MKHLIDIADLSRDEAIAIMDEADRFKEALDGREIKKLPTLRGRTIFTLFYENSTRTRSSFETAGKWMSADVINLSASTRHLRFRLSALTRSWFATRRRELRSCSSSGCRARRLSTPGTASTSTPLRPCSMR